MKGLLIVLLGITMVVSGCTEEPKSSVSPTAWGPLPTYRPRDTPKGLVLFLSDQAGWTPELASLSRTLATLDYLVVGVDSRAYL